MQPILNKGRGNIRSDFPDGPGAHLSLNNTAASVLVQLHKYRLIQSQCTTYNLVKQKCGKLNKLAIASKICK